jgi:hypothetical protein
LIGCVRGIELAATQDVIHHGRDIVIVDTRAEERDQVVLDVLVAVGDIGKLRRSLHLGESGRQLQSRKPER